MADNIITGLDIGSHGVRVAVGQPYQSENDSKIEIQLIGAVEVPSSGVHRGTVTAIEDAVSSVSKALELAERLTGVPINTAWVGVSGSNVITQESHGTVGVGGGRPDSEIGESDIERAMEAAKMVAMPNNYEILHTIPKSFSVDGQRGIKDPVGMTGVRIEVDAMIVQVLSAPHKNLMKCVYRTGLEIEDMVLNTLAVSDAVLTRRQKELGVCVLNLGAATTSMAVYEEGELLHLATLPIGAEHITNDIAIGLRTSLEVAEVVKVNFGTVFPNNVSKKEEIDLAELGAPMQEFVSRKYIAQIAEARAEEIFEKINKELEKIDRAALLPAGVVVTGGGAKLDGMIDLCKKVLRLPVSLGLPLGVTSVVNEVSDPIYSTAIGLVLWGAKTKGELPQSGFGGLMKNLKDFKSISSLVVKTIKSLKP